MARGIIIFGSAGVGKTTLGRLTAQALGFPYFDLDDYIWQDTPQPFSLMYSREEKINRLMRDISKGEHFVMAGSMDSFHAPFDPLFDLAVHLTAPVEVRLARLEARESALFGTRILPGGDLYEEHRRFLASAAAYDEIDASPSFQGHSRWAATLSCPVPRLNGADSLEKNRNIILDTYKRRNEVS